MTTNPDRAAIHADDAEQLRSDLYDDLNAFARETQIPGLQHAQIRDELAVFLTERLLRRLAAEAPTTTKPEPEAEAWDVPDARPGTTDYTLTHRAAGMGQDGAQP